MIPENKNILLYQSVARMCECISIFTTAIITTQNESEVEIMKMFTSVTMILFWTLEWNWRRSEITVVNFSYISFTITWTLKLYYQHFKHYFYKYSRYFTQILWKIISNSIKFSNHYYFMVTYKISSQSASHTQIWALGWKSQGSPVF